MTLVDDHRLKCIGEAGNGLELLDMLKTKKADVVLLDLKMPEMEKLIELQAQNKLKEYLDKP